MIVPIGGDGTFLLAAGRGSPIGSIKKPIVGFNSDPVRSEGRLMLPKQYSYDPKKAVQKLLSVKYRENIYENNNVYNEQF